MLLKKRTGDNLSSSSPSQISVRYILEIHFAVPAEKPGRAQGRNAPQCTAISRQHAGMTATWGEEAAEGVSISQSSSIPGRIA